MNTPPMKFTYNTLASKSMDETPFFVTSLSQTIVDYIRHIDLAGGLEELMYALSSLGAGQLNERDLLVCLEAYDIASLWCRVGNLLSLHQDRLALSDRFLNTCRIKGSGRCRRRSTAGLCTRMETFCPQKYGRTDSEMDRTVQEGVAGKRNKGKLNIDFLSRRIM